MTHECLGVENKYQCPHEEVYIEFADFWLLHVFQHLHQVDMLAKANPPSKSMHLRRGRIRAELVLHVLIGWFR